jgi:hypothetical protein
MANIRGLGGEKRRGEIDDSDCIFYQTRRPMVTAQSREHELARLARARAERRQRIIYAEVAPNWANLGQNRAWHAIRYRQGQAEPAPSLIQDSPMIAHAFESTDPTFAASSDLRTQAAVAGALASSQYAALRRLDCRVTDGVVEISGIVSSFYLKQLAQAAVLQLHQARVVRNLVEVEGEAAILVATHCGQSPPSGA